MNGANSIDAIVMCVVLLAAIQGATVYAVAKLALTGRPLVESVPKDLGK